MKKLYSLKLFWFFMLLNRRFLLFIILFIGMCLNIHSQTLKLDFQTSKASEINLSSKIIQKIYGANISGNVHLKDNSSFVRIILEDENKNQYLIKELYYPLFMPGNYDFVGCDEKDFIYDIIPKRLLIECENIDLFISSVEFNEMPTSKLDPVILSGKAQLNKKIEQLNANLKSEGFMWRAKVNESNDMYSKYKGSLEYKGNSYGFEYYSYGIFSINPPFKLSEKKSASLYVDNFDWRYRHGAMNENSPYYDSAGKDCAWNSQTGCTYIPNGWLTPIRSQRSWGNCPNGCFAFSVLNAVEARMNLYYNNHLDYDLSEQDAIDCNPYNPGNCYTGGYHVDILEYVKNYGAINESCFPYINDTTNCVGKCNNPGQKVVIENYYSISSSDQDNIKRELIKNGPMHVAVGGHSLCLVGFGKVTLGTILNLDGCWGGQITIDSTSPYLNKTFWILKDSRTASDCQGGYNYVLSENSQGFGIFWGLKPMTGYIKDIKNPNLQPRCVDLDGDGYYNWGIGPKPAFPICPLCCPDEEDGDDSNPNFGPMDVYGNCTPISSPYTFPAHQIITTETWQNTTTECGNVIVTNIGNLTISGATINLEGNATFSVEVGGTLTFNSGTIQ